MNEIQEQFFNELASLCVRFGIRQIYIKYGEIKGENSIVFKSEKNNEISFNLFDTDMEKGYFFYDVKTNTNEFQAHVDEGQEFIL